MSEEKKAIEYFKEIIKQTERANECGLSTNDFSEEIKIYNTVLNLIEKKNEDIQRMQELLDKSDARNVELNKEIEIKDKMIDRMGEDIFDHYKFLDRNYGDEYPLQYKNKEEIIREYKIDAEKIKNN